MARKNDYLSGNQYELNELKKRVNNINRSLRRHGNTTDRISFAKVRDKVRGEASYQRELESLEALQPSNNRNLYSGNASKAANKIRRKTTISYDTNKPETKKPKKKPSKPRKPSKKSNVNTTQDERTRDHFEGMMTDKCESDKEKTNARLTKEEQDERITAMQKASSQFTDGARRLSIEEIDARNEIMLNELRESASDLLGDYSIMWNKKGFVPERDVVLNIISEIANENPIYLYDLMATGDDELKIEYFYDKNERDFNVIMKRQMQVVNYWKTHLNKSKESGMRYGNLEK